MTPTLPDFRRGNSFSLSCTYKEEGVAVSVAGYTIRAQIRSKVGALVADLQVVIADQSLTPGLYYLTPTIADTSAWPIGSHNMDVVMTFGGVTRSTEVFAVPVIGGVTV